jgi:hypothetical protein
MERECVICKFARIAAAITVVHDVPFRPIITMTKTTG